MTTKPDKKEAIRHFLSLFPEQGLTLDFEKFEDEQDMLVKERAFKAFCKLREEAKQNGADGMSLDEINEEIATAREERDAKAK